MKRLLIWSATLILIFSLLLTASRAIGGSIKSSKLNVADMLAADSYLGTHGWCWRDICPGQTSISTAVTLLQAYNDGLVLQGLLDDGSQGYEWTPEHNPGWKVSISEGDSSNKSQLIDLIHIHVTQFSLRLHDMIAIYGDPIGIWNFEGCYYLDKQNLYWGNVVFSNGIAVSVYIYRDPPLSWPRIIPEMLVSDIDYFDPSHSSVIPWKGYTLVPSGAFGWFKECYG